MENATSRRTVLIVSTLGSFLTPFMASSINIALPSIGQEFAMSAVLLSWVATAYLLAAAMFLVPFGRAADIHGRKKVFLGGITVYMVFSLACGLAPSAAALIAFRALQGVGGAMIFGTGVAILTSVYPANERGRVLGINVAAVYLGLSLGPFLGGLMTQQWGWRSIFLLNVPLSLFILAYTIAQVKAEWAGAKGEPFDWRGSILYGVGLAALMYGFSRLPGGIGWALVAAGLAGMAGFAAWEMRVSHPVLDIGLFRKSRSFTFSNLAALINYCATAAVGFLLSLYLQYIKGFTPRDAGIILVAQPVVQAVFSPLAGRLSDRIEPRVVASIGMGLGAVGLGLLTLLGTETEMALIIACLVLLGFGFALFSSPNTNAVMSAVERRLYGVASATLATMRLVGQTLSMGIVLLVFSLTIGQVRITPEYYPAFLGAAKVAFVIFAILCFGGVFASLARGNLGNRE